MSEFTMALEEGAVVLIVQVNRGYDDGVRQGKILRATKTLFIVEHRNHQGSKVETKFRRSDGTESGWKNTTYGPRAPYLAPLDDEKGLQIQRRQQIRTVTRQIERIATSLRERADSLTNGDVVELQERVTRLTHIVR